MALSNIFREPRRELTEQAFGLVPIGGFSVLTWFIASGWCTSEKGERGVPPFAVYLLVTAAGLAIGAVIFVGALFIAHAFGEAICGAMAERGFDPRPKDRR